MTPFPAVLTPFPKIPFNNNDTANNVGIPPPCLSLTPFPKIPFTDEKSTGSANEEAIGTINLLFQYCYQQVDLNFLVAIPF